MSTPETEAASPALIGSAEVPIDPHRVTARGDFIGGLAWLAFGALVLTLSLRMDRLGSRGVNPYTAPGLVPGLLGVSILVFGGLLLLRSLRHGGLQAPAAPRPAGRWSRILVVVALCLLYAGGLVGRGPPFWLASALYVSATIAALRYGEWKAAGRLPRGLLQAAAIGLCSGVAIAFVFEQFFLVRLP